MKKWNKLLAAALPLLALAGTFAPGAQAAGQTLSLIHI